MDDGDWNEYRRLVMDNFVDVKARLDRVEAKIDHLNTSVTILKVKATMWGVSASIVVTALIQLGLGLLR